MRIITYLGWKTSLVTVMAGAIVGLLAWLIVPHAARLVLPIEEWQGRLTFSCDGRLMAFGDGNSKPRHWRGELRVWDIHAGRQLCAIPHEETYPPVIDGGHSIAFTPDADKLVTFAFGAAKFYTLPSGEPWQPDEERKFPFDGLRDTTSRLVSDAEGRLFVLTRDEAKKKAAVQDLWTGQEQAAWEDAGTLMEVFPGGIIEQSLAGTRFIEIPSGNPGQHLAPMAHLGGSLRTDYYAATPDGRTLVGIDGAVRVCIDGTTRKLDLRADQFPVLSPDGRRLAVLVQHSHAYRDWRSRMLTKVGLRRDEAELVVYDLAARREIAVMRGRHAVRFTPDGKTLIAYTGHALELYDVPFAKPWSIVVGMAFGGAGVVFAAGQWLRWRQRRRLAANVPAPPPKGDAGPPSQVQ